MRVVLNVPFIDEARKRKPNSTNGEHIKYDGQSGEVICGAGIGGVYVRFDGMPKNKYIGCPIKWLTALEENE